MKRSLVGNEILNSLRSILSKTTPRNKIIGDISEEDILAWNKALQQKLDINTIIYRQKGM